jgi:ribosomal protein S12 methylthiotransferase accessory factor
MKDSGAFDRLADISELLIDQKVGIIQAVRQLKREAGAPNFFHYYAYGCNTAAFCNQRNFRDAGGASVDRRIALAKAIGETIERYCSAIYERGEFPLFPFDRAPFRCVPPENFALYSREQYSHPNFPYAAFTQQTPIRWAAAIDPSTNETLYVPAAMVVLPYSYDGDQGESPIAQRISTGLACHGSFAQAAISAVCEVIERDAFTIAWQARLSMPRIQLDSLSDANRDLVQRFEKVGDVVVLINLTMDVGVPTILGVLCGRAHDAPAFVFAASADMDAEKAVRKSLEELAHTRQLAQQLKRSMPRLRASPPYDDITEKDHHVHLYCDHVNAALADFVFASKVRFHFDEIESLTTGEPEDDLKVLVNKVRQTNHRVLLADLTTPDVDELGLKVVRAIIPGFHPLFMGHNLRALGGFRLWEVPQNLGYEGITRNFGDNGAPHPYP